MCRARLSGCVRMEEGRESDWLKERQVARPRDGLEGEICLNAMMESRHKQSFRILLVV